jgi:hypothetical protein
LPVTLILHERNAVAVAAMVVTYPDEYWFTLAVAEGILFPVEDSSW